MSNIKIGNYNIENYGNPFIIAEAGINHNGDINLAYKMIEVAKKSGANAIKFQTFKANEFVSDYSQTYTYKSKGKYITESMLKMFERYEFSKDNWSKIVNKCKLEEIMFLSTPQNPSDLDFLLNFDIKAIKVGSDDFNNIPLLKYYASKNLPLILSCGMADMAEIYNSLSTVGAFDGFPVILLLCTSQYPTPPEDVNLLKLKTLKNSFPMINIGFSDHTQGFLASSLAVSFGACVFEKHFTLDNNLEGPDHWFSENPESLEQWVKSIITSHKMMGSPILRPTDKENEIKKIARRTLSASLDIKKGELLDNTNICLLRPNTGISSIYLEEVIGKHATKNIKRGDKIQFGDFK